MSVELLRPGTLAEAHEMIDEDTILMAGGQSIVLLMNTGLLQPERIVLLDLVEELRGIDVTDDGIDIGALTTHQLLARHPAMATMVAATAETFGRVGNARVRSVGTLGGNLVHADPAQDPPVLLAALDATATLVGPGGSRVVATKDLALGPFMPALDEDEILTRVHVPRPAQRTGSAYVKFQAGTLDDYATVSVAACVHLDDSGVVRDARLAAGAVGPTVVPLDEAADLLVGQRTDDADVLAELREHVSMSVSPLGDRRGSADYKREMTGVVAARAVVQAARRAPAGM
jgi:carbon-monoxide dehydrogenase medium subunit